MHLIQVLYLGHHSKQVNIFKTFIHMSLNQNVFKIIQSLVVYITYKMTETTQTRIFTNMKDNNHQHTKNSEL